MDRRARKKDAWIETVVPQRVFERDNWTCMPCGDPLDREVSWDRNNPPHFYPTVDHVMPLAMGGDHSYSNVQAAHWICNVLKNDMPPVD